MTELTELLVHHPECKVREIGDGLVIMPPQGTATHSLEGLGAFIWGQMDGNRDLATILAAILNEYNVAEDKAQADLVAFVDELLAAGLIRKAGD